MTSERMVKKCLFIGMGDLDNSPPSNRVEFIANELIEPALADFPDIELTYDPDIYGPALITDRWIDQITSADLVIADLGGLHPVIMYGVGARQKTAKPLLLLTSEDEGPYPFDIRSHSVVIYNTQNPKEARNLLASEIFALLEKPTDSDHRNMRADLPARIQTIAGALAELRINSLAEYIEQLEEIGHQLTSNQNALPDNGSTDLTKTILSILAQVDQIIGSSRIGKLVIAGALAGLVTGGGVAAAAVFTLSVAVWDGPSAFKAAVDKLTRQQ